MRHAYFTMPDATDATVVSTTRHLNRNNDQTSFYLSHYLKINPYIKSTVRPPLNSISITYNNIYSLWWRARSFVFNRIIEYVVWGLRINALFCTTLSFINIYSFNEICERIRIFFACRPRRFSRRASTRHWVVVPVSQFTSRSGQSNTTTITRIFLRRLRQKERDLFFCEEYVFSLNS